MGYFVGPCNLLTRLAISAFLLPAGRRKRRAVMKRAAPSRSVTGSMVNWLLQRDKTQQAMYILTGIITVRPAVNNSDNTAGAGKLRLF
jgi:hypothetical protein